MKMNTRRTPASSVKENYVHEESPPQVELVPQEDQGPHDYQDDQFPIMCGGNDVQVDLPELRNRDIRELCLLYPEP